MGGPASAPWVLRAPCDPRGEAPSSGVGSGAASGMPQAGGALAGAGCCAAAWSQCRISASASSGCDTCAGFGTNRARAVRRQSLGIFFALSSSLSVVPPLSAFWHMRTVPSRRRSPCSFTQLFVDSHRYKLLTCLSFAWQSTVRSSAAWRLDSSVLIVAFR